MDGCWCCRAGLGLPRRLSWTWPCEGFGEWMSLAEFSINPQRWRNLSCGTWRGSELVIPTRTKSRNSNAQLASFGHFVAGGMASLWCLATKRLLRRILVRTRLATRFYAAAYRFGGFCLGIFSNATEIGFVWKKRKRGNWVRSVNILISQISPIWLRLVATTIRKRVPIRDSDYNFGKQDELPKNKGAGLAPRRSSNVEAY